LGELSPHEGPENECTGSSGADECRDLDGSLLVGTTYGTRSVLATGMVAGIFLVTTALSGIWFGSLVDRYRKKTMMQASSLVSLAFYAVAFTLYQLTAEQTFANPASRSSGGPARSRCATS